MRRQTINSLLLFVLILLALTPAIQTAAQDKDSAAAKEKEVTILVDHYRAPCVDGFRSQWCYLVATAEKPNEFPVEGALAATATGCRAAGFDFGQF